MSPEIEERQEPGTRAPAVHDAPASAAHPAVPTDDAAPPSPRRSHGWLWLLLLIALAVGGYFAYRHFHTGTPHEATQTGAGGGRGGAGRVTPVVAAVARRGDLPLYLNGLGTVTGLNTVTVRSRVDGQLDTVAYTEGQFVKQGDLLAQIDPRAFQVQLEQAEAQLAKDQSALQNAQRDLERDREAADAISRQQLDTQAALVTQYEAALKIDQAMIDSAKLNLSYARITAPVTGRVGLRLVDPGNMIHATDATGIAVVTQLQPISVVFTLPQDDIARVLRAMNAAGGNTPLPVDAYDRDLTNKLASGTLSAVDNQVDPTTGTVRLKATFPNEDSALFPNQFVNARLLVETRRGVTLVPGAAIQRGPDSTFVYVVNGDAVALRNVRVGPIEGEQAVVEEGLEPGEVVVTDGVDKLQEGSKVNARVGGGRRGATTGPTSQPADSNGTGRAGRGGRGRRGGGQ